jgi:hypothetical protein
VVNVLSQFVNDPRHSHLEAANRVLRYLKSTPGQGILIPKEGGINLIAYCDSDWLGCPFTRRLPFHISFLQNVTLNSKDFCDSCVKAKFIRLPFPISTIKTSACFDLIHCDVWGKYRTPSFTYASYFLTIFDDFSRAVWVFLLKHKHEASTCLVKFHKMVQTQFDKKH